MRFVLFRGGNRRITCGMQRYDAAAYRSHARIGRRPSNARLITTERKSVYLARQRDYVIHLKKVHHFLKDVLRQFLYIVIIVIRRIVERNRNNFFVQRTSVNHLNNAYRITANKRRRINCFVT